MESKKVRIQRVAENEEIIVASMDEDLIQQYERVRDLKDAKETAHERFHKIMCEADGNVDDPIRKSGISEAAEAYERADYAHKMALGQFWLDTKDRYQIWSCNVGIRDNYAIVKIKGGSLPAIIQAIIGGM